MWQNIASARYYHLVVETDGNIVMFGCGIVMERTEALTSFVDPKHHCDICDGIWRLVYTSVDDAKNSLRNVTNLEVLQRSILLTKSKTLKKLLESRIRKL